MTDDDWVEAIAAMERVLVAASEDDWPGAEQALRDLHELSGRLLPRRRLGVTADAHVRPDPPHHHPRPRRTGVNANTDEEHDSWHH